MWFAGLVYLAAGCALLAAATSLAARKFVRLSSALLGFGRIVIAIAAILFGLQHLFHPELAPGVPSEMKTPSWVPYSSVWGYLAGAILLAAGIGLAVNKKSRIAAASIGSLMTVLTLSLYMLILIFAHGDAAINQGLNLVADTLLYAGAALVLASALPHES